MKRISVILLELMSHRELATLKGEAVSGWGLWKWRAAENKPAHCECSVEEQNYDR